MTGRGHRRKWGGLWQQQDGPVCPEMTLSGKYSPVSTACYHLHFKEEYMYNIACRRIVVGHTQFLTPPCSLSTCFETLSSFQQGQGRPHPSAQVRPGTGLAHRMNRKGEQPIWTSARGPSQASCCSCLFVIARRRLCLSKPTSLKIRETWG